MSNILLLGNKKYSNLNLNILIDKFDDIWRLNFTTPLNKNVGSKIGTHFINVDLHRYFIINSKITDEIYSKYSKEGINESFISNYYEFINNPSNYKSIIFQDNPDISKIIDNYILSIYKCPYLLDNNYINYTIAINAIIYFLKTDCLKFQKLFICGMSVDLNDFVNSNLVYCNYTYNDAREDNIHWPSNLLIHSFDLEVKIKNWMHQKGLIDMTLCLLKDYSFPYISYNSDINPSKYVILKLIETYKLVLIDLKNTEIIEQLLKKNYNFTLTQLSPVFLKNKFFKTDFLSCSYIFEDNSNYLKFGFNTDNDIINTDYFTYTSDIINPQELSIIKDTIYFFNNDVYINIDIKTTFQLNI
jgi:hypothetical protein